jgi:hydroxymethylglutaryl-CoA synthase
MKVGIVGYGAYIPRRRIRLGEIAAVWGADAATYERGLELHEKSVPAADEDTVTMSVTASRRALARAKIDPSSIGAVYVGSESHPYAVKPSGTVVAEALGATPAVHCADLEFACKAGSEGMFLAAALVKSGEVKHALAVGADTSQGAPGDALEYSAAAGAAAFIFGSTDIVATLEAQVSYMTDTPDFWRREYMRYPRHAGRFTGEPAYFKHTLGATRMLLEKTGLEPKDFAFAVFHQPNGKFPMRAGTLAGFRREQLEQGCLAVARQHLLGASPIGLTAILDQARAGDRILMVSYGSGAGSDGFVWTVTERIDEVRAAAPATREQLDKGKLYVSYGAYAKLRGKIRMGE